MKRLLGCAVPALVVVLLSGCNRPVDLLPDGGRPRRVCQNNISIVTIKTVDLMGQPVPDANVVATNESTGETQLGTTDGNGVSYAVTDEIGDGLVDVIASAGSLKSAKFTVQVTCGECDCTAMPASATLILQ